MCVCVCVWAPLAVPCTATRTTSQAAGMPLAGIFDKALCVHVCVRVRLLAGDVQSKVLGSIEQAFTKGLAQSGRTTGLGL